jgi:hypothetical protein
MESKGHLWALTAMSPLLSLRFVDFFRVFYFNALFFDLVEGVRYIIDFML